MRSRFLMMAAMVALAACGDDDDGTGPTGGGSFSATVAGTGFSPTAVQTQFTNNLLSIGASASTLASVKQINITVMNVTGPGTYQLGSGAFNAAIYAEGTIGNLMTWQSNFVGGTGELVLTQLTSNRAVGTFTFTGVATGGGATGTKAVTNGSFNVTF